VIRAKVDADHASVSVTRRSRTGFLVWINSCLVYFLSKKQTSVEFFTIGSEFVAMEQCCEYLRGLRYKLGMLGIPVNGPCYICGDNCWKGSKPLQSFVDKVDIIRNYDFDYLKFCSRCWIDRDLFVLCLMTLSLWDCCICIVFCLALLILGTIVPM
jgi:hypothetical protein